jgi:HAD domain in Swiss Army Knife RNA repair proteins
VKIPITQEETTRGRCNETQTKPLLFIDVDGVISLFGFREGYGLAAGDAPFSECPPGRLQSINGVLHYISSDCGAHLTQLAERYELVWATGWEEAANDYLPHLLGLPGHLPVLTFDGRVAAGAAHWKVDAIAEYAGARPLAWIDDNIDETCHAWAAARPAPTLIVETLRHVGMDQEHVELLLDWAAELNGGGD